jgi:hypothetical protein
MFTQLNFDPKCFFLRLFTVDKLHSQIYSRREKCYGTAVSKSDISDDVRVIYQFGYLLISIWVSNMVCLSEIKLKMPKGQSEAVNLRRTDNAMVKQ